MSNRTNIKICPYSQTLPKLGSTCASNCWAYIYEDCLSELEKDIELYNRIEGGK